MSKSMFPCPDYKPSTVLLATLLLLLTECFFSWVSCWQVALQECSLAERGVELRDLRIPSEVLEVEAATSLRCASPHKRGYVRVRDVEDPARQLMRTTASSGGHEAPAGVAEKERRITLNGTRRDICTVRDLDAPSRASVLPDL